MQYDTHLPVNGLPLVVLSLSLLASTPADADDDLASAETVGEGSQGPYDPDVAAAWSVAPTAAGTVGAIGLMIAGGVTERDTLLIGGFVSMLGVWSIAPSSGHLYAQRWGRGFGLMALRLGLASLPTSLLAVTRSAHRECSIDEEDQSSPYCGIDSAMAFTVSTIIAVPILLALGIYDMATAPRSARAANREHRRRRIAWSAAPAVFPATGDRLSYGAVLELRF